MADFIFDLLHSAISFLETILNQIIEFVSNSNVYFSNANPVWTNIMNLISGTAFGLVVVFTYINIIQTTLNIKDARRLEPWVQPFLRFAIVVGLVLSSPLLIQWIADIGAGLISTLLSDTTLSPDFSTTKTVISVWTSTAPFGTQWLANIGVLVIILIIYVLVLALGVMIVVTLLTRQFKLMIYAAISPVALSQAASEQTQQSALNFMKKFAALALQGFIIIVIVNLYSQMPKFLDVSSSMPTPKRYPLLEEMFIKEDFNRNDLYTLNLLVNAPDWYFDMQIAKFDLNDAQLEQINEVRQEARQMKEDIKHPETVPIGKGLTAIALDLAMLVVFTAILRQSEQIANDLLGVH
ncbi:MAG: type IV secretion system protein [Saccharofermentanales bacterium]|jgi:flagellar basal body-associated protein FliL